MIINSWESALTICAGKAQAPWAGYSHSGDSRSECDIEHMPCLKGICWDCSPLPALVNPSLHSSPYTSLWVASIHTKYSGLLQKK